MKIRVHLLMYIIPLFSFGQVSETFDDNRNAWNLDKGDNFSIKIESGKLVLTTLSEGYGRSSIMPWYFDKEKSFVLEASFVQRSGSINNGFGLYFGMSGKETNEFVIASDGHYKVGNRSTNKWKQTKWVKPVGEVNVLRIEKKGEEVKYILNGKKIDSNEVSMFGDAVGYLNYTNMVLELDDFKFIQDNRFKIVENIPQGLIKENLGSAVNTTAAEVGPIITTDGRSLYFGREHYENNTGGKEDGEDIWIATRNGDRWENAVNPGRPVNSDKADNLSSVSADNNTLIFSVGRNKFIYRNRTATGWSDPVDLGPTYVNEAEHFESQLAADGKAILFTAKSSDNIYYRKEVDERDIYVCVQDKEGKWSNPINLGKTINTRRDEASPFLAADGRTLYFASNGWPGYGSSDIFVAKRIGKGWTKWTEPLNLGPQINSAAWEAYYTIPASGEYAYMVSHQNTIGKTDIFRVKLPQQIKPDPVILILGKVLNSKTKQPVAAEIILENLTANEKVVEAISNPKSGEFRMVLPVGANYGLRAAAKGFLSVNENMELASITEYTEVQKNLFLVPIEVGETLQLNNVFFEQGKAVLRPESFPELDRLAAILKDNPTLQIELAGHTDNLGNAQALIKLSQERVDAVKKYLEGQGTDGKRITGKGYGSSQPIEKNDTEEHKKRNRRVEFKITKS
ncbi:MAG: Outer membrane lipoprotein omp16 precursor [Cytophagales bacterium]|jgi:outer membrane protein OmpA-like peptidoglycan-associated protein|nr:OmpA family protein [Bacteroidota bacterium]MBS1979897.1 OmpA family protein [Bacteroidota bacterium]WHZ07359.1 MAG: Outer membrane lipoprotein omp16 precursor [Cytophagales bacterium]